MNKFFSFFGNEKRALGILLCLFFALALSYSTLVPLFEGPDEDDHFRYAKYIADQRALPIQLFQPGGGAAGHQGWQPPLYYALVALVIAPIDTPDLPDHLWRNLAASYQGDPACCGRNLYFHTSSEDFPYTRTTLAVHLARSISILFGLVAVAALFWLAREVFLSNALAFITASVVAFNPSFLFASALVSNDTPLAAFCSLALLVGAKILNGKWKLGARTSVLWGVIVGLGILTKTTALGLIPFVLFIFAFVTWHENVGPSLRLAFAQIARKFLVNACVFGFVVLALTGWYFVRNQILYGDPLALRLITTSAIFPRESPPTIYELLYINLPWLWQTFWGGPVPGDFSPVLLGILTALTAFALLGLAISVVGFVRRSIPSVERRTRDLSHRDSLRSQSLFSILLLLAAWLAFILISQIQFIRISGGTDQGRYLFPAIASFAILFVFGWRELLNTLAKIVRPALPPRFFAAVLPCFLLALALYVPFAYVLPAYARPPQLTEAILARADKTLDANFVNQIDLRGYSLSSRNLHRGDSLRVTLYWNALARMTDSYRVFAHLVGANNRVAGGKDFIPVRGAYATVLWSPGEWVEDVETIDIAQDAVPGTYQLEVGLYPYGKPDERLNLANSDDDHVLVDALQISQ